MSKKVDVSEFIKKVNALSVVYKKLPDEIAAIAVKFSKERFREQNWFDKTKEDWPPLKRKRKGGKKRSQTPLVKTGRLKKSVRKISADQNRVVIGTDVPYAKIHNEGGILNSVVTVKTHSRKAHSRVRGGKVQLVRSHVIKSFKRKMSTKIPKRQYLGPSEKLTELFCEHGVSKFEEALKTK